MPNAGLCAACARGPACGSRLHRSIWLRPSPGARQRQSRRHAARGKPDGGSHPMTTPDWMWPGAALRPLLRRRVIWAMAAVTLFAACSSALEARPMRKHRHHAAVHLRSYAYPQAEPFPQTALPLWRQPCFSLDDCDRKAFDQLGDARPNGPRRRPGASRGTGQLLRLEHRTRKWGPLSRARIRCENKKKRRIRFCGKGRRASSAYAAKIPWP